eukprot:Skav213819  [mRNA]  locus=scaffold1987:583296:585611:+ [translate_table: standard]
MEAMSNSWLDRRRQVEETMEQVDCLWSFDVQRPLQPAMESEDQDTLCPASSSEFEQLDPCPDLLPPGDTGGAGGGDEAGQPGHSQPLPAGTATMLRARLLARMAMDDLRPEAGTRQSSASHVQKLREECQAARSRIQQNVSSVSKVFEMTRSLESYILNLEDCKNRVKQKRNARWSDLAVCQRRLEILSQLDWVHEKLSLKKGSQGSQSKPAGGKSQASNDGSRSRGSLVEALEVEQEALLVLRRELGALISELEPALETALDLRKRLQQEASERRKLMRKDHATLTGGESEREDWEDDGSKSLDSKNFWVKKAQHFEESAQHLLQKAVSTIQWTDLEFAQANQCVAQCLAQCSREDQSLRRQLDAQLRDVDFAISCADWTINKPENRLETASAQVQRAQVLLHELTGTRKQLKCLVRKCKKDLQTLESCRNTTVHTLQPHTSQSLTRKKAEEKQEKTSAKPKQWEETKSKWTCDACETEHDEGPQPPDRHRSVAQEAADLEELRFLQAEERRLRSNLRSYETRIERCAMWSEVLADLEDCLVAPQEGS